jgi:hypothetical protein
MDSQMWAETKSKARKRFVEIVTMFSELEHNTKRVSVPLLVQNRDDWKRRLNGSDKAFRYTGDDDKTESELLVLCGDSPHSDCRKVIRKYSYANILYQDVRGHGISLPRPEGERVG